jgi:hypothetical protein
VSKINTKPDMSDDKPHDTEAPPQPTVVKDEWEVRQELRALGLSQEAVRNVASAAASAKADTLPIDPVNTPGTQAYIHGIRSIRRQLLREGWRMSRAGNVESTVNDDRAIQICFQNVGQACGDDDPESISPKGSGARKLVRDGHQAEMFERESANAPMVFGTVPTVWVICVSTSDKRLRAEVSCPKVFEGDQFAGFSKRIFVVDEDLDPTPDATQDRGDGGSGDHEVRITKKSA